MTLIRESLLYRLCLALAAVYESSALHRLLAALGRWCNRQIDESVVLRPLCREGAAARAWKGSLLCRVLSLLVNLPGWLLHRLYNALPVTFEDSFFARLAFAMGEETAVAESWLVMLLWIWALPCCWRCFTSGLCAAGTSGWIWRQLAFTRWYCWARWPWAW